MNGDKRMVIRQEFLQKLIFFPYFTKTYIFTLFLQKLIFLPYFTKTDMFTLFLLCQNYFVTVKFLP
jgi:hypothetical protein